MSALPRRLYFTVSLLALLLVSCSAEKTTAPRSSPSIPSADIRFQTHEYDLATGVGTLLVRVVRSSTAGPLPFSLVWLSGGGEASAWADSLEFPSGQSSALIPIGWAHPLPTSGTVGRLGLRVAANPSAADTALVRVTGQAPPPLGQPMYFPLEVGNVWAYDRVETSYGFFPGYSHETDRIIGTVGYRGKEYAVLKQIIASPAGADSTTIYLRQESDSLLEVAPGALRTISDPWVVADLGGSTGKSWTLPPDSNSAWPEARAWSIGPAGVGEAAGISYRAWSTRVSTSDAPDHWHTSTWTIQDSVGIVMQSDSDSSRNLFPAPWSGTAVLRSHHAPGR